MRQFPSLEESTIRSFARAEFGRDVGIRWLGGYLGRNGVYLIEPNRIVLKVFFSSKDSETFFDRASEKQAAEAFSYQTLGRHKFPVPNFVSARTIEGHPCILYRYVSGELWQQHAVRPVSPAHLYERMGGLLARMHDATLPYDVPPHMYDTHHDRIVDRALKVPQPYKAIMQNGVMRLRALDKALQPNADAGLQVLTHGDFTPRNILLHEVSGRADIAAVIDFERARIEDPTFDFAMIAFKEFTKDPEIKNAILRGYAAVRTLPEAADMLLQRHLLRLFLEIAGWARQDDFEYFLKMTRALERLLDGDDVFRVKVMTADLEAHR
jgi:Ser/Thr protein kinase RdoA (MazF antagonist)